MKAYKLTDKNNRTRNTQWGEGISHTAWGTSNELCSSGFIHFYTDPVLAVLMNPIHANFSAPNLWEIEYSGETLHEPLKSGAKTVTTIQQIPLPKVTIAQRIAFGILCAKEIYLDAKWNTWADNWLNGTDRSDTTADAAKAISYSTDKGNVAANAAYAAATAAAEAAPRQINFALIAQEALKY